MVYRQECGQVLSSAEYLQPFPDVAAAWLSRLMCDQQREADAQQNMPTVGPRGTLPQGRKLHYFGDYEILEEIAHGGMGVVYKARQLSLNRDVALKMIRSGELASKDEVQRFRTEAEAAANLDHPNIVPIYEVGEHDGQHYFSMKLSEGGSLADGKNQPPSSKAEQRKIARRMIKIADAVHHAHQRGILHRDLKPANILLDANGEPLVTDFGLAKRVEADSALTQTGALIGTPSYMSPEQTRGPKSVTTASDVYCLGAILYELLTGEPPFRGENILDTLAQIRDQDTISPRVHNAHVERDFELICLKCLQKEPAKRYSSAKALAEELEKWLHGESIDARAVGQFERTIKWAKRNPAVTVSIGAAFVVALSLVGIGVSLFFNSKLTDANDQLETALDQVGQQKEEAEKQRKEAERQKREADKQRLRATRFRYAAQINLAKNAYDEKKTRRTIQLLHELRPEHTEGEDLRDFEWYRLWRLCHGYIGFCRGHKDKVSCVSYSQDGKQLVSGSFDKTVRVWDADTGKQIICLKGHRDVIEKVTFLACQNKVAAATKKCVIVWDTRTGHQLQTIRLPERSQFTFSEDGGYLAVAYKSAAKLQRVRIWSLVDRQLMREFKRNTIAPIAFVSKNQLYLGNDNTILDVITGQRKVCKKISLSVRAIVAAQSHRVATTRPPKSEVSVWDLKTAKKIFSQKSKAKVSYISAALSPNGKQLAVIDPNLTITVGNLDDNKIKFVFHSHQIPLCVAFSPTRHRLVAGCGNTIYVWDIGKSSNKTVLNPKCRQINNVVFSPDGKRLAIGTDHKRGIILETSTGKRICTLDKGISRHQKIAFRTDGKLVSWAPHLWDANTGKAVSRFIRAGHRLGMQCPLGRASISPNANFVAIATRFETVDIWNCQNNSTRTLSLLDQNKKHRVGWPCSPAFSPDGKLLAIPTGHDVGPGLFSFPVILFDTTTWREIGTLHHTYSIWDIDFSPDGKYLAAACGDYHRGSYGGEVKIWNIRTRKVHKTLTGYTYCVWEARFSPNGQRLATASGPTQMGSGRANDGLIKLWDTRTFQEVLTLRSSSGSTFYGVDFSPDGTQLAAGTADGKVYIWDAPRLPF